MRLSDRWAWFFPAGADKLTGMSEETSQNSARTSELLPSRIPLSDGRVCVLREMVEDDAAAIIELLPQTHAQTDFVNYFPGEFDWTLEREREFLRKRLHNPLSLSIAAEVDGRMIGLGGAAAPEFKRMHHQAELGLVLLEEFWRRGIGRRMMDLMIEWGRRTGLHKMYLRVYDYNERAMRMYEALGFVEEARLREDIRRADGSFGGTVFMSLVYDRDPV